MERIGLIDLGSNTARLVIFDCYDGGYFVTVDEMREAVRLGETEKDGSMKATRIIQAINTVKTFKKMCMLNKVDSIIAVATAAVRRARNQRTFLNEMFSATGIKFRVVTEEEEATLVYQGVINSMDVPKGLIMEIGGGSTKFIYYNRRNILNTAVIPVGAVTLTEMFSEPDKAPEQCAADMETYFKELIEPIEWLTQIDPDTQMIGVGGSFRNLARLARRVTHYPLDMVHNYSVSVDNFNKIYDTIKVLDADKKSRIKGISTVRADVFPSALSAIKAVFDYIGFEKLITCGCGLREGLMFNKVVPSTIDKPISDVLGHSLLTATTFMQCDQRHAEQVFGITVQLFKQLRVLHKFPRLYVKVLRIAAYLCDTGRKIKFYNNAKHAAYYILNSNIYGVSHHDLVLAAYVCDYYNKEESNWNEWEKYRDHGIISDEDIAAVRKLAVLLKLARTLDISHTGVVEEINCDVLGDSVIMKLELNGDASLELKAASEVVWDFRRIYRKNLEII